MRHLRASLLLALACSFLVPAAAHAQYSRRHPLYLHALSDLRAARAFIWQKGGNAEMREDERGAIGEIDAAMREIQEAAIDDGKNLNAHPPLDSRLDYAGQLHRAIDLLHRARADISGDEDNEFARGLRRRALLHIDEAIRFTEHGLADQAPPPPPPPPPPDEEASAPEPEEPLPEEVTYEDAPDEEPARAVYEEPPDEPPPPVAVRYLPPPMRYEPPPPMPEDGMYWVGGYWVWDDGGWAWMSGHWILPPRPMYLWVSPYYEVRGGLVIFVTGHWGPPGYVFRPPPPSLQIAVVEARPAYRGSLAVSASVSVGIFVPPPPGSRPGIIVPAPLGTPPQVVVGAPPVVRPGMVVRGPVNNTTVINNTTNITNVTVVAPAGVTRTGAPVNTQVPNRAALAASLPPKAAVAPPPPPPSALALHPAAFSPNAAHPPKAGEKQALPRTVTAHPSLQTLQGRPPTTTQPSPVKTLVQPSTMQKTTVQPPPGKTAVQPSTMQKGAVQPAPGSTQSAPVQLNKGGQLQRNVTPTNPAIQQNNTGGKTTMMKRDETPKVLQRNTVKSGEDRGHPKVQVERPNEKDKEKDKKK